MKIRPQKRDDEPLFGGCLDIMVALVLTVAMGGACLIGLVTS